MRADYALDLVNSILQYLRIDPERLTLFNIVLRGPHVDYFDFGCSIAANAFDARLSKGREGVRAFLPSVGSF